MIPVTKSFLPPIEDYKRQIDRIWENQWLTNRGPLTLELELALKNYLNVDNIILTTNGTLPLQIALKLFGMNGDIITTPFSYVATTSSIIWENCQPVFVDIHPDYMTIDETKLEAAITENTTAILATHVYGNPCDVDSIQAIAAKYGLKVIYDAAHCFGVRYNGESIFNFGDVSTCSFHATKLFHCGEGGALFSNSEEINHKLFYSHNFGHNGPVDFHGLGINAKISELQSAMGLSVLPFMEHIITERKKVVEYYDRHIDSNISRLKIRPGTEWNYSYYPVIFENEAQLLTVVAELEKIKVIPRRYFYPSLNTVSFVKGPEMPVSESIARKVICLPLYVGLATTDLESICKIFEGQ